MINNLSLNTISLFLKNPSLQEEAVRYRQQGLTYKQISDQLNVPPTTIRNWTGYIKLTPKQKQNIKNNSLKYMSNFWLNKRLQYQQEGINLAKEYINNKLFIMMCGIYWGEGHKPTNRNKNKGALHLSNTDIDMIKLWINFLKQFFNINKNIMTFRIYYSLNNIMSIEQAEEYWLKNLNLKNLKKVLLNKKKLIYNNHPYGVCHVIIYNTKCLFQMIGAIKYVAGLENSDKWNY